MPIPLTLNSVTYQYPKLGDENWGQDATNWAVGITQLVNSIDTLIDNTLVAGLFELGNGSVATPSLRFQNSLTTGIYRNGSNVLAFSAAGVQAGQISATGRLQFVSGSLAAPTFSFLTDTDTGIFNPSANNLALVTAGIAALTVDSSQNVTINGNLTVTGDLQVDDIILDDLTATGNIILGNADTDTLNIGAELISNIVPDVNNTYSLGTSGKRWSNVFSTLLDISGTASINTLSVSGASTLNTLGVSGASTLASLSVSGASTLNTLAVSGASTLASLSVSGASTLNDLTANGNSVIGNADTDSLSIVAELISNIVPDVNNTYNLGSSSKRWATVFTQSLNVAGTSTFNDVTTTGNTTIGDADTDTLNVVAELVSNIVPDVTNTYDLGTSVKRYRDIFAARNVYGLRLLAQNGSAGSPSISFENDDTLGIYRDSGSSMQFVSGGANRLQITNTQLTPTVPLKGPAGSTSDPTYSFSADPDTGMYRSSADILALVTAGVHRLELTTAAIIAKNPIYMVAGSASVPSIVFEAETNTGFFRASGGALAWSIGGSQRGQFTAASTQSSVPFSAPDGSASAPSYTFTNASTNGFYNASANQVGIAIAGVFKGAFRNDGFYYNLPYYAEGGSSTSASYTFLTDTNTGLYQVGADEWGLTAGGTLSLVGGVNSVQSRIAHGFIDGTASIPGLFFNNDTNTGIFRISSDNLGFATAGNEAGSVDSTRRWTFAQTGDSIIHRVNGAMEFRSSATLGVVQDSLKESTLTDNSTGSVFEILSANSNIVVLYSIVRGSGKETGQLIMSSDGTTVQVSGQASTVVDCGVSFSGDINAGNIRLRYTTTSTGSNATMRYSYKRWAD